MWLGCTEGFQLLVAVIAPALQERLLLEFSTPVSDLVGPAKAHIGRSQISRGSMVALVVVPGNVVPLGFEYPDQPASLATVRCDAALGGLLNHYYAEQVAA
jgi:hypothetical protein